MSELIKTRLPYDGSSPKLQLEDDTVHVLNRLLEDWKAARFGLEMHWRECWAMYFGTKNAEAFLRSRVLEEVGDVGKDWRHHITQAKAYDIVETAIPYFKSASFPNDDWFDLIPVVPIPGEDLAMGIRVLKSFVREKLDNAMFKNVWEIFLRQLCICGTSILALPWRMESRYTTKNVRVRGQWQDEIQEMVVEKMIYNAPEMSVEDCFDIYLDPDCDDPNQADMIRRFTLRRGEMARLVKDGVYDKVKLSEVNGLRAWKRGREDNRMDVDTFYNVETAALTTDVVEIYEFWGCLELPGEELYDIVATWSGDKLLRLETNPYRGGRPFVIGRYTPIPKSPYGWGMLSPIMGNLHELNILANSRLDGLEITLQPTFLINNDGTVDPNDVVAEPGRVIPVANVDSIRQLITDNNFAAVSMQEEVTREQLIERRTGTSSFVGTAPGRSGERVTAAEVDATQSAGGNRLSGVYELIERECLLTTVQRTYEYCQQFQSVDEIIPVQGNDSSEMMYAQVGPMQLTYDMKVKPIGAKHIANKEHGIRQMTDWLAVMNSNEMLMQQVNWEAVAKEVTRMFIEQDPDKFINGPQQMAAPQQAPGVADAAASVGGNEFKNAVNAQMMADGGMNMAAMTQGGLPTLPQSMTPNESQAAIPYANAIPTVNATPGANLTAATNLPA